MASVDPLTGKPLPADVIQRILFISPKVHIYQPPPLTSTKGYMASTWTADNNKRCILENARLRIIETAIPCGPDGAEDVSTNILLEDSKSGELFAAAPYITSAVVEQVLDSSRFFAIRVQGEGGRKAILGIGFEERSEAFDFGVCLQEARKGLDRGMEQVPLGQGKGPKSGKPVVIEAKKKDYSLKAGETITVSIGGKGIRHRDSGEKSEAATTSAAPLPFLPPPPSAEDVKAQRRKSQQGEQAAADDVPSAADLGFDDGEFGEFQ